MGKISLSKTFTFFIILIGCKVQVIDEDGNTYKTTKIGDQEWMAENLKTTKYNNGIAIDLVIDNTEWDNLSTGGYCWYDNDQQNYRNSYGALYNWHAVNTGKLCPEGWHVPTDKEWTTLLDYLGGEVVAGGKLKETGTEHWNSPNTGATNDSGFNTLPAGYRDNYGGFDNNANNAYFWSSTEDEKFKGFAFARALGYNFTDVVHVSTFNNEYALSCRCIKD